MNGPDNYKESVRLLAESNERGGGFADGFARSPNQRAALREEAQVRATLALAAAASYPAIRDWLGEEALEGRVWLEAMK